ncbi:class I SAM-dependent methyltransferase [Maricaulis sp.]|uniref:class I SAM-dependent methyltransferase n=1 Tax=Maricaulis sp. TaxID=1486257 RepID=UPI002608831E|nr:class I SAM-dependent methyltransferase [Maricaulis sp.]
MSTQSLSAASGLWGRHWQDGVGESVAIGGETVDFADLWSPWFNSLPPGAQLLDLACGAGSVSRLARQHPADLAVTGVDIADRLPEIDGVSLYPGVDLAALPFQDTGFDGVMSQFGFEYADTGPAAREAVRVLRPGGGLGLLVHAREGAILADTARRAVRARAFVAPDGIVETIRALLGIEAQTGREGLAGRADYLQLAQQATDRHRAARDSIAALPATDTAVDGLARLDALWRERKTLTPDEALARANGIRDRIADYAARLDALAAAARSESDMAAMARLFTGLGVVLSPVEPVMRRNRQFGWWLSGRKQGAPEP